MRTTTPPTTQGMGVRLVSEYRVTMTRLGRGDPPPPFIVNDERHPREPWDAIEEAVFKMARKYLVSRGFDVGVVFDGEWNGHAKVKVFAGFHTAGEGTVEPLQSHDTTPHEENTD